MYFRVKAKPQKYSHFRELRGAAFLLISFLYGYCLVLPDQSGAIGKAIANISFGIFGFAVYLVPLLVIWAGVNHLRSSVPLRVRLDSIWSLLMMVIASSFFSMIELAAKGAASSVFGGWVGLKLNPFFYRLFGTYLSLALTAGLFIYVSSLLLRVSLRELAIAAWRKLEEDYNQWQDARKNLSKILPPKIRVPEPKNQRPNPVLENKQEPKIISTVRQQPTPAPQSLLKRGYRPRKSRSSQNCQ